MKVELVESDRRCLQLPHTHVPCWLSLMMFASNFVMTEVFITFSGCLFSVEGTEIFQQQQRNSNLLLSTAQFPWLLTSSSE